MTQEQLADDAELHRNYLSGIERGAYNIGVSNLVALAKALQTTASALLAQAEARDDRRIAAQSQGRGPALNATMSTRSHVIDRDNRTHRGP